MQSAGVTVMNYTGIACTNGVGSLLERAQIKKHTNKINLLWDGLRREVQVVWECNHEAWSSLGQCCPFNFSVVMEMSVRGLSNIVIPSHLQLLDTWNVRAIEERNVSFYLILIKCK